MSDPLRKAASRWLGVGLASLLAVVTLGLAVTGRLQLYINPAQTWFAVAMSVLALGGAVASFALPPGSETDHGHDHGDAAEAGEAQAPVRRMAGAAAGALGGIAATGIAVAALVLPAATLSVDLAMDRDTGAAPLFAGADDVQLAGGDLSGFGVGEWATVFQSAANPDQYAGTEVTLTGFVVPGGDELQIGRLVITHCIIDAQSATLPIDADGGGYSAGEWVEVEGTVEASSDGVLTIEPTGIAQVAEPDDPYEY